MSARTFNHLPGADDPRNHEYKGYICLCFVCGNKYLGPKRSVMCNLCANGKKPVDKE
ncbi:hypothetical protein [Enterobacter phage vB_ExiM_F5M1E]|uniref:Uncharacterized protein n=1 Tax=Cronobacter phage PBES 02 TaxID=1684115 RepID=A0A0K1YAU1_9CAUD|nr:hypothetical protein ADU18_0103 [Cronobacter phage PBES 02]QEG12355.1 hypothetical protein OMEGA_293 [Klebsiella phage vB_KaeM_KaOmega]UNA02905.1 hypothetical protein [Enterobacter phage vB_ExiM_F1M1E]UNA03226.1 hypothetical protein [Enterobacter phage vB_ExiM_F2M1E]UNA03546.1 hypothetical protein [Enterobacter phage vB_ExiM_F4M1E]UNA03867.1 hypothetical protein [Enterobacter phage vB_ExiM_F5M1E]UNA04187.1 hypothetical protein [Pantoea phage vB_PdiM_F5M2A]